MYTSLLQGADLRTTASCGANNLVAGHELGGVVPGVVAGGVSQVGVQVGNGALQGGKERGKWAGGQAGTKSATWLKICSGWIRVQLDEQDRCRLMQAVGLTSHESRKRL
jgi:hypothetical protein